VENLGYILVGRPLSLSSCAAILGHFIVISGVCIANMALFGRIRFSSLTLKD